MKLTEQQRKAVQYPGSVFVEACPGSGKTRTIAAKLLHLLDDSRDTPRKIACITYTNGAVHEIENRIRSYGWNASESIYQVATIHSFCLRNVFGPYYWKLPQFQGHYELVPPDSEKYSDVAKSIYCQYGSNFTWDVQQAFRNIRREHDGSVCTKPPLNEEIASLFLLQLERERFIDFNGILYYSFRLLVDHPKISNSIAARFSWILVDEFQDTTSLQIEILKQIARFGLTKFFLVGDPNQSIFGFTGAKPSLMNEFSDLIQANSDFVIDRNWRSSKKIINDAEKICRRVDRMLAVGEYRSYQFLPIHTHARDPLHAVAQHFFPILQEHGIAYGDAAILAPQRRSLRYVAKMLINQGVSIVGVGARPYNTYKYTFASFLEKLCASACSRQPHLIRSVHRELLNFVSDFTGQECYDFDSFVGRRLVVQLIRTLTPKTNIEDLAEPWITAAIEEIVLALRSKELLSKHDGIRLSASASELIEEISKSSHTPLSVRTLSSYANYRDSLKLLTIHGAKGLEFEAVALIDLHQDKIPHSSVNKAINEFERMQLLEEEKRKLYVGITRAKRILMYVTDDSRIDNVPSELLNLLLH